MMICIQCAMRALLDGDTAPVFDETEEEHMKLHHPDPITTRLERKELERQFVERMKSDERP